MDGWREGFSWLEEADTWQPLNKTRRVNELDWFTLQFRERILASRIGHSTATCQNWALANLWYLCKKGLEMCTIRQLQLQVYDKGKCVEISFSTSSRSMIFYVESGLDVESFSSPVQGENQFNFSHFSTWKLLCYNFFRAFSDVCIGSIEWVAMEGWTYIFRHFKRGFNDFSTLAMICQSFWFEHSLPQAHQCHHPLSTQLIWCRMNRAARFILGALGAGIWNEDNEEEEGKLGSLSFSLFTFNWIQLSANERKRRRMEISKHEESWRELNAQG